MLRLLIFVAVLYGCMETETKQESTKGPQVISCNQFIDSIKKGTTLIEEKKWNSAPASVLLVKLDNTLSQLDSSGHPDVIKYRDLKGRNSLSILDTQVKYLNAGVGMGMGYYSPSYKLYIGGSPDSASMFFLEDKKCLTK